jgi:RNA polymerase-binding transcription factor DksA
MDSDDAAPRVGQEPADEPDLEQIAADLAGVEQALQRLEDGTYWTDELTGDQIPDDVLTADPIARRAPPPTDEPPGSPPPDTTP